MGERTLAASIISYSIKEKKIEEYKANISKIVSA